MNSHPLVSVIVPVYNVEQYLEECVKSILSQTYKNLEIILVDDGATDSSGRMCDSYAADDGRIKVVHKENGGLNSARQAGFEHAHGEWIAFVDSDDVIDGRYIELLLEANAKYGTEIAICGFSYFDNTIKKDTRVASFCMKDIDTVTRLYLIDARPENKFFLQTAWAKLFKRKLIEQVDWDFSDYRSNEDELMSVYYYKNTMNGVSFVNNQLYYYRQNPDSIMSKAQVEYKNSYKGMPTSKFEFLEDVYQKRLAMFGSKYRDEITYYYAMHFMVYIDKEYRKMPTYRLAKQEAELFNSKLDDIHKANKKYVFYDEYSDIFKVVSKKRDIQAFFDYRNSHPLVSVIVPVYNVEQYLEECVKSILSQTYKNLEIILVDDGATDSSGRMCDSYAADDGRIKVVHKENGGVSRARNTGIEKSKGEYVLFVDADDYLAPKAIAVLVAQANAVAGVDMVIGDYAAHHSLGYEEEALQRNLPVRQSFTFRESNSDAAYSLLTMVNATFCKLIKKDILIAHDISFPENLKIAEDLVFCR